ncbi:hypothetical protein C2G38_2033338 [Gigaspora rosea]|uniref:Protein kinase domain-containing protein n=1 Tax=Gigaspora rosea TaxID=44941 RepID=A0A397VUQ1_9GLOM|nr:hypothetical protein C2G38_2033338 [Gigaspora rosea]
MPDNRKSIPDKAIGGLVRVTREASKRLSALQNNQSVYVGYIDSLLNDIAKKVPINRSRLSSNNKIQKLYQDQIVIPIRINAANDETEKTAAELASVLAYMIRFKNITTISSGVTNDLDPSYDFHLLGFIQNNWNEYEAQIIVVIMAEIMAFVMFSLLFHILSYKILKYIPNCTKSFDRHEKLEYIFEIAIIYGAFFDIFFRNTPQIIIQIIYYKSDFVLVYNWVPLLLLITSSLKIFMTICCFACKRINLYIIKRCNFYGRCIKCKRPNISPTWCKLCDPLKATKGWTSGNKDLDKYIKGLQIKVMEYEKMIEWIPFERLTNFQMIREEELGMIFMATWLDGIRIIEAEFVGYKQSRIESCGVNLIILHDFQTFESFKKKLKNYMQLEGNVVYGITQNTETNQYIIVIPDEFNSRRNHSYGVCIYCNFYNTSPAWCQSCDPWKVALEWTNKNKEINNLIEELIKEYRFKAKEYEKVIEWIPFDELINLIEIKGVSCLVFMATWVKGVRTIKSESGKYTQSRTISSVDLMKLNYSQTNTLELLENVKVHIQSEEYRIHGITQSTETSQYMLIIDFYNNKRKLVNGICEQCKRYNTSPAWCYLCDPPKVVQETSGDKKIDNCIKEFQLKATAFENVIEWIPFNKLENIKMIGKGGFGTCRKKSFEVALKKLPGSQTNSSEFLNEFKHHMQCRLEGSALEVYGLTRNAENGQYMMVYQYANRGNLHDFLTKNFRELVWRKKLKQLADISHDLSRIHKATLIHDDFHSGNVLLNQDIDGNIKSYITDLGLSRKQNEHVSKGGVYGVLPYVAPEVLEEITTGKRPYNGSKLDDELALKICTGLRPEFAEGTPDCYIELAKQCMDSNPKNRPTAEYVYSKVNQWKTILDSENLTDKEKLEIKEKFIDADRIIKQTTLKSLSIFQNKYCSALIDVPKIVERLKGGGGGGEEEEEEEEEE